MYNGVIQLVITFIATLAIYLFLIEGNPFQIVKKVKKDRFFYVCVAVMLGVIGIDRVELFLENRLSQVINWDISPSINQFEGNITMEFQKYFLNKNVTEVTTFFYVFVFPALVWVALAVFSSRSNTIMMKKLLFVFILNYCLALPFYILFLLMKHGTRICRLRILLGHCTLPLTLNTGV